MIEGRFGDEDELFFEVELIANNGLELPVDALLDTGFSGWLAMDNLGILDWRIEELKNWRIEELKQATWRMNPGACTLVGAGVPSVLIGRQWLKNRRLVVDMSAGILTLEAS